MFALSWAGQGQPQGPRQSLSDRPWHALGMAGAEWLELN
jgi:hypothetical protein